MSKTMTLWKVSAVFVAGAFLFARNAPAQTKFDRKALLQKFRDASNKIPVHQKKLLSSGMQNFLHLAEEMNKSHTKNGIGDDGGLINIPSRTTHAKF